MPSLPELPPLPLPHTHHHPLTFDFQSIRDLPESHTWPDLHDHPISSEPIPLIDLSNASDVLDRLAWASEKWGAFQLTGHGVPLALLDRLLSQTRRLFTLPAEHKLRAARTADSVSGYGLPFISRFFSKLMWCEGFTIVGSPHEHACKLWPDDDPSPFCVVVEEYTKEMKKLAERLMRLLLLSLGIEEEEMNFAGEEEEEKPPELCSVLQLNSYPPCPDPDRAIGLAAHTDSSLFTILHQSNAASGLQLLRPRDPTRPEQWARVPPVAGALVVNVGDMMQILSNGRFKSVVHRAVVNRDSHRVSAAYICGPPAHVRLSPARRLVVGPGPAYRSVTWAEYLGLKGQLSDKALTSITIPRDSNDDDKDI